VETLQTKEQDGTSRELPLHPGLVTHTHAGMTKQRAIKVYECDIAGKCSLFTQVETCVSSRVPGDGKMNE
jgi:hypothetical protein